jgi:hypothetical protein
MNYINGRLSSHGKFAIYLLVIGALLAIDSFTKTSFAYKLWPLLITLIGIGFLGIFWQRAKREFIYLSIGIYFIGFSAIALYCNFTSWSVLSTLWPLFITILGVAFIAAVIFSRRKRLSLLVGLLLLSLSAVFFLIFSVSAQLWWTAFILAGLSILASELAK